MAVRESTTEHVDNRRTRFVTEGRVSEFFDALKRKKDLILAHDPRAQDIHITFALGPGGNLGAMHAGFLLPIMQEGYAACLNEVTGVSAGVHAGIIAVGGSSKEDALLFEREVCHRRLVHGGIQAPFRRGIQIAGIEQMLEKVVSRDRLAASSTTVSGSVTTVDGEKLLIQTGKQADPIRTALGSSAVPIVSSHLPVEVSVDGSPVGCLEGGFSSPIAHVPESREEHYTLVLQPGIFGKGFGRPTLELLSRDTRLRRYNRAQKAILNADEVYAEEVKTLRARIAAGENIGIISMANFGNGVDGLSRNWQAVRSLRIDATEFAHQMLGFPIPAYHIA